MSDETLERLAIEEILKETQRASVRANEIGPQGWKKCPIPSTNKRFLHNTIIGTLSKSKKRQLHQVQKNTDEKITKFSNSSEDDEHVNKKGRHHLHKNCDKVRSNVHRKGHKNDICSADKKSESYS